MGYLLEQRRAFIARAIELIDAGRPYAHLKEKLATKDVIWLEGYAKEGPPEPDMRNTLPPQLSVAEFQEIHREVRQQVRPIFLAKKFGVLTSEITKVLKGVGAYGHPPYGRKKP